MTPHELADALRGNLNAVIQGKAELVERVLTALFAGGNVLLEDVPGVGKTTLAKALAVSLGGEFRRIQFTPDMLPADILGGSIFSPKTGEFTFREGPVFCNVLLADEISPDSCRLWDIETGQKLDKDVFRRDLGSLADAYTEVARRLGVLPSNVTHAPKPTLIN